MVDAQNRGVPRVVAKMSDRNRLLLGLAAVVGLGLLLWLFSGATNTWVEHTDESGYAINYPDGWQFVDGQTADDSDIITSEQGTVVVNINKAVVGSDLSGDAVALASAIEELYGSVPFQSIDKFDVDVENEARVTYETSGIFTDGNGTEWQFEEKGFVFSSGEVRLARVSTIRDQAGSNRSTMDRLLDSFRMI